MDENRVGIISESNRIISKLQLHSVFFNNEIIYKIYLRTNIIHQLFEQDSTLDINKLDLFHVQFTASVIDLLKKIKKSNERTVSVLYHEIELNEGMIEQLSHSALTESSFNLDKQRQALKINTSLRKLYQVLSDDSGEYPFSKNINAFSLKYSQQFFFDIDPDMLFNLTEYQQSDVYSNAYAVIQRKLMGLLCKHDFKSEFFCGLKAGDAVLEVYKLTDQDKYFYYYPNRNIFELIDISLLSNLDFSNPRSKRERIIQELQDKNDQLLNRAKILKSNIPPEVQNLLTEYYKKISDVDFLQNISNFDVQTNILRTMLNTDSF